MALSVARKMGRNVPKDLAVTGFDNDFISNYVSPTLTTVEIQKEEVAKSAMEALLALIRNEKTDKRKREKKKERKKNKKKKKKK